MTDLNTILLAWTSAFVIVESVTNALLWKYAQSKTIKEYYHKVPLTSVVIGDYMYSTLILLTAISVFDMGPTLAFLLVFLIVQWIFDITWYLVVSAIGPKTPYLDFFYRYAQEIGFTAVLGDSMYGIVWLSLTFLFIKFVPPLFQLFLIVLGIFYCVILTRF